MGPLFHAFRPAVTACDVELQSSISYSTHEFFQLAGRSNRERKRQQAQKDLEELESKREALRGLLGRSD